MELSNRNLHSYTKLAWVQLAGDDEVWIGVVNLCHSGPKVIRPATIVADNSAIPEQVW